MLAVARALKTLPARERRVDGVVVHPRCRRTLCPRRRSFVVTSHEATHWDTVVDLIAAFHVIEVQRTNRLEGHSSRMLPHLNGARQSAARASVHEGEALFGLREAGVEVFGSPRGFAGLASLFEPFPSGTLGLVHSTSQGSTNQLCG